MPSTVFRFLIGSRLNQSKTVITITQSSRPTNIRFVQYYLNLAVEQLRTLPDTTQKPHAYIQAQEWINSFPDYSATLTIHTWGHLVAYHLKHDLHGLKEIVVQIETAGVNIDEIINGNVFSDPGLLVS